MPSDNENGTITVALLGNPNTGKTTLFNAILGTRQRVANYPGVTVEEKIGQVEIDGRSYTLVDLPGTYSLAPRSPDEMVTVDMLLGRHEGVALPDVVLCIVDASNLERNLYLVSQALEFGTPIVIALNKIDLARENGVRIDVAQLQQRIGVTVVPMQAHQQIGLDELKEALHTVSETKTPVFKSPFPETFQREVASLEDELRQKSSVPIPHYLVERLLLDSGGYLEDAKLPGVTSLTLEHVRASRDRLERAGYPVPAVESLARYDWISQIVDGAVTSPAQQRITLTDRIDRVLTHKVGGTLLFIVLMVAVFQSIFTWSQPLMNAIERGVGRLGEALGTALPTGAMQSLIVDGVVAGVGSVLVFLPQIFILFFFIAVMEECGYMSRAAYLMDRMMSRIGLSGKSFIPLLSSFACAVPGIMAARVIEDRRDRLVTVLVAPLMTCSARLPVYTLLIAAFIPDTRYLGGWIGLQGMTMFAMYFLGILAAVLVAFALKKTILQGATPAFIMELPSYKLPSLRSVLFRVWESGWSFIQGAGTLILAVTILVWAAGYFPRNPAVEANVRAAYQDQFEALDRSISELSSSDVTAGSDTGETRLARLRGQRVELEHEILDRVAGAYMQQSLLGRAGKLIEPVVRPLGWDWRIGCAVIASFPAREVVIGALGVIYQLGEDHDEQSESLRETLQNATWPGTNRLVFNVPVALSIMVFFALCAQCAATLATIHRETKSWRWPLFTFVYMTTLAYVGALVTYRLCLLFVQ